MIDVQRIQVPAAVVMAARKSLAKSSWGVRVSPVDLAFVRDLAAGFSLSPTRLRDLARRFEHAVPAVKAVLGGAPVEGWARTFVAALERAAAPEAALPADKCGCGGEKAEATAPERVLKQVGPAGAKSRERFPADVFLDEEGRRYPVKLKVGGEWRLDRALLIAAARRARMNGESAIAQRAEALRAREFPEAAPAAKAEFTPTAEMRAAAARGLELRRKFNRGGTMIGVARARDLANGRSLSADTVKRMHSYFARHAVDKAGEGWGVESNPSAGYIAWLLWGGDAGAAWAKRHARALGADEGAEKGVVTTEVGGKLNPARGPAPLTTGRVTGAKKPKLVNVSTAVYSSEKGVEATGAKVPAKPQGLTDGKPRGPRIVDVSTAVYPRLPLTSDLPVEKCPPLVPWDAEKAEQELPVVKADEAADIVGRLVSGSNAGLVLPEEPDFAAAEMVYLIGPVGGADGELAVHGLVAPGLPVHLTGEESFPEGFPYEHEDWMPGWHYVPVQLVEAYDPPLLLGSKVAAAQKAEEPEEWFPPLYEGERRIGYYVVLEPGSVKLAPDGTATGENVDRQGDVQQREVIEVAAHDYLANYGQNRSRPPNFVSSRTGLPHTETGYQHAVIGVDVDLVESWVTDHELTELHGNKLKEPIPAGTWLVGLRYRNEDLWQLAKRGEVGVSPGGMMRVRFLNGYVDKTPATV